MKYAFTLVLSSLLCLAPAVRADDATEAKLRENLKNVTLQLRTAQNEKAAMAVAQAEKDAQNKALELKVKEQGKRLEELDGELKKTRESARKIQEEQTARITRMTDELAKFKTALDKWQAAHTVIENIAKKKEAERSKFAAKAADTERKLADCRARNSELYKLGSEILERYRRFGIGEALAAREPFTGNAKVKLDNLIQDYGDKLLDQTAKP